jgi:transposase
MGKSIRFVGLDVHAETINAAVAEPDGEVRSLGTIANRPEAIGKLVKKLGSPGSLRFCYEAGATGYALYWELSRRGVLCEVIAPSLVPVRSGDRVKTDRRDAMKLARSYRSGDLTPVWVPDGAHEALRDLVRARETAREDQLRARNRLSKFLLRHGRRAPDGKKPWTLAYTAWVKSMRFAHAAQDATLVDYIHEVDHAADRIARLERALDAAIAAAPATMRAVIEALQALRGVARVTAATIVAEVGSLARFARPKLLMGYAGMVASEDSSGKRIRRGGITKTGNAHLRRVLIEAAWSYRHRPSVGAVLRKRQAGLEEEVKTIAWKAQHRLHRRYFRLLARGKPVQMVLTAVARELLGFIWAIGVEVEQPSAAENSARQPGQAHRAAAPRDLLLRTDRRFTPLLANQSS